jgi:hypothetical protein
MIRNFVNILFPVVSAFVLGFILIGPAPAHAQHGDVFLADVGGSVAVGSASDIPPANADLTTRLFEGVMIPNFPPFSPADYGRDDPGFFGLPAGDSELPAGASALPGNAEVTINLTPFSIGGGIDALFYWDGGGAVDFQPISTSQPGVTMSLDGNPIGTTGPNGGFDLHPAFELDDGGAGVPANGVYLIAPTASVTGLVDSDRFYMVWLADAAIGDEADAELLEESLEMGQFDVLGKNFAFFEEAVDYVHDHLVVPEPTGLGLVASALAISVAVGVSRRGRRREAVL